MGTELIREYQERSVGTNEVTQRDRESAENVAERTGERIGRRAPRHRTLSPTERPRHFSTLGTMETGRKKTVNTRHTLERAQQTTIFRLRTGHCGLSAHLKRIGFSDTSLCECRQTDQTPDHFL